MKWSDQKTRIRRFLRDPDGNIWTDAFLLRCYNDEQSDIQHKTGILEKVEALRVPPMYQMSYMNDWEWPYVDQEGKDYQCFRYHHQSGKVCSYRWEIQHEAGLDTGVSEEGSAFIHPWEAWCTLDSPNKHVPIWFPVDFYKAKFVAWDKEPLDFINLKDIQSYDSSWVTHSGKTFAYGRYDELSNEFFLYPRPSTPVWEDVEGDVTAGMTMFVDDDEVDQDYGVILQRTGMLASQDLGLTIDIVDADDNIFLVYEAMPADLEGGGDESEFPEFLQKYNEYGAIERAYSANTDGKIESLRDYWATRRRLGLEAIKRFKSKRKVDRDYRLVTQGASGFRTRKEPRLPDTYPAVYR